MERESLLAIARQAALRAYAPYSHFRVGAAVVVITPHGPQIITGANIENASFGLTLCAERSAIAAACSHEGIAASLDAEYAPNQKPRISHIAVACIDAPLDAPMALRSPCGACRQWFAELAPEATYYIDGVEQDFTLSQLLPQAFRLDT